MAHLVKQKKTYHVDAAGRRCPKDAPGAKKLTEESSKWYAAGVPGWPKGKRVPLATHRRVAEQMLAELIGRAERGIHGLPDKTDGRQPLAPLVAEFGRAVRRKAGEHHTKVVLLNVNRVLGGCKLAAVADLLAADLSAKVEGFVWGLIEGEEPLLPPTANAVGKNARQFCRWLWRKKKVLQSDPLAGCDWPSPASVGRRRALTPEELAKLVTQADGSAWVVRGLIGPHRAALYLAAASTGLRAGELAVLTTAHLDLDADVPVVRLRPEETKNGKGCELPLPSAVVRRLRPLVAGRAAGSLVWPGTWKDRAAQIFARDLTAAGVPIVVAGEVAEFHSLRHTFTTMLGKTATVKVTQELARHSTPALTIGRYTHTDMTEKAGAVERMALPGGAEANPLAALSRADLEKLAAAALAVLAALGGAVLVTPRVTPEVEPAGDVLEHAGTTKGKRPKRGGGRKG